MDISLRGLEFIKKKEGYFDKAYRCPAGIPTLGYGSIRWDAKTPVKMGDTCTREQAERLLLKEVQRVEDEIDRVIKVPLTQGQGDCLVSFFYNLGLGWLNGKGHPQATFVKYLNRGEYDKVPSELLKFKNANGKPINALLVRRQEEIQKLWFGKYNTNTEEAAKAPTVVETDPSVEPMPQAVQPDAKPTATIVKESPTAQVSIFATLTTAVVKGFEWLFSTAKEAGIEAATNQSSVSGLQALWTSLGITPTNMALAVCVAALAVVLVRRIGEGRK